MDYSGDPSINKVKKTNCILDIQKQTVPYLWQIIKKIRNKVTHDKEAAKKAYFENLFNNTSNSTDTWKLINRLLRKHTPKAEMPLQLKVYKKTITNPSKICNEINQHFVEIGEKLSAKVPTHNNDEQSFSRFLGKRQSSSIVLQSTDEHEIIEIIAGLICRKSAGYTDILQLDLKNLNSWSPDILQEYLTLYIPDYFYILFVPGRGGKFTPLSKNRLVSDRIEIFCLLKLLFVKFFKINFWGCDVTKTMMTSSKPENPYNSMQICLNVAKY